MPAFLKERLFLAVVCALGLLLAYHPMILSGFERSQTDPGDPRLNHYILEHETQWLLGNPNHASFWSPPVFFPQENVAAFTEILLGLAPLYWLPRLLGIPPDPSFQIWILLISILNFLSFYLLLRRALRFELIPSAAGAFLFTFASTRLAQLGHHQLQAQFYTIGAVYCLIRMLQERGRSQCRKWIAGFAIFSVLQIYSGIYLAWFLGFGLFWTGVFAFFFRETRKTLLELLRRQWLPLGIGAFVSGLALIPVAVPYLESSRQIGYWGFGAVFWLLPSYQTWVFNGSESWLYFWQEKLKIFRVIPNPHEKMLGIGWIATIIATMGIWGTWKAKQVWARVMVCTFFFIFLIVTIFPGGFTLWEFFHDYFPAAKAIRGVCRIALLFLIPAGIGVAFFLSNKKPAVAMAFFLVIALEQGRSSGAFDLAETKTRENQIIESVQKAHDSSKCRAFFFSRKSDLPSYVLNLDAMWAGTQLGIPTLNGYNSKTPKGWKLDPVNDGDRVRQTQALMAWSKQKSFKMEEVCWID